MSPKLGSLSPFCLSRRFFVFATVFAVVVTLGSAVGLGVFDARPAIGADAARPGDYLDVIDADSELVIGVVSDDEQVLHLADIAAESFALNLVGAPAATESVTFDLSGPVSYSRIENTAPYAAFGNRGGDFFGTEIVVGSYTMTVEAFSSDSGRGESIGRHIFEFEVTDALPPPSTVVIPPSTTTVAPTTTEAPPTTVAPTTTEVPTTTGPSSTSTVPPATGNCPGTTDLPSCVDDIAASGGGVVTLDAKTYVLRETLQLQSDVDIVGQGSETIITWDRSVAGSIDEPLFYRGRSGGSLSNVGFEDLHIKCSVDTSDVSDRNRTDHMGIFIDGGGDASNAASLQHRNITMENIEVSDCGGMGIHIKGADTVTAVDLNLHNNGWGTTDLWHNIYLLRVRNVTLTQTNATSGGFFDSPAGHGLRMGQLENVYFENLTVAGNADHGIHMNDVSNLRGHELTVAGNCADPRDLCRETACYSSCDYNLQAGKE